jgi:hypothetical protein
MNRPQDHNGLLVCGLALLGALVGAAGPCRSSYAPSHPAPPDFQGGILHRFDFESGGPGPWTDFKLPTSESLAIVNDPLQPSNRVARFVLRRDDPIVSDGKRSELQIDDVGEIGTGCDYWYGFRMYLPADWEFDHEYEVLAQWKGKRDRDLGEQSKSPALALRSRGNVWYITNRWDDRAVTPANHSPNETLWQEDREAGVWTEWVVHARWSFRADGLLEIWKDGRQIVEKQGPNTYNDRRGMYFKIWVYKSPWGKPDRHSLVDRRVVYHDDVWIGVGR